MLENDLKNTLGPLRYSLTIRSAEKYTVHASSPVQRYDQPTTRFEPKRTVLGYGNGAPSARAPPLQSARQRRNQNASSVVAYPE